MLGGPTSIPVTYHNITFISTITGILTVMATVTLMVFVLVNFSKTKAAKDTSLGLLA